MDEFEHRLTMGMRDIADKAPLLVGVLPVPDTQASMSAGRRALVVTTTVAAVGGTSAAAIWLVEDVGRDQPATAAPSTEAGVEDSSVKLPGQVLAEPGGRERAPQQVSPETMSAVNDIADNLSAYWKQPGFGEVAVDYEAKEVTVY